MLIKPMFPSSVSVRWCSGPGHGDCPEYLNPNRYICCLTCCCCCCCCLTEFSEAGGLNIPLNVVHQKQLIRNPGSTQETFDDMGNAANPTFLATYLRTLEKFRQADINVIQTEGVGKSSLDDLIESVAVYHNNSFFITMLLLRTPCFYLDVPENFGYAGLGHVVVVEFLNKDVVNVTSGTGYDL